MLSQLHAHHPPPHNLSTDVQPSNTVEELKTALFLKEGIPPFRVRLSHGGRVLDEVCRWMCGCAQHTPRHINTCTRARTHTCTRTCTYVHTRARTHTAEDSGGRPCRTRSHHQCPDRRQILTQGQSGSHTHMGRSNNNIHSPDRRQNVAQDRLGVPVDTCARAQKITTNITRHTRARACRHPLIHPPTHPLFSTHPPTHPYIYRPMR